MNCLSKSANKKQITRKKKGAGKNAGWWWKTVGEGLLIHVGRSAAANMRSRRPLECIDEPI